MPSHYKDCKRKIDLSFWEVPVNDPGKLFALVQNKFVAVVAQLQLIVKTSHNSVLLLLLTHSLEHPKLIDLPVARPLHNISPFLETFLLNVQIQLIHIILDDVNLSCLEYDPSLIVSIVRLVDYDLLPYLIRSFRNIYQLVTVSSDDETGSVEHLVLLDCLEQPDIRSLPRRQLFTPQLPSMQIHVSFGKLRHAQIELSLRVRQVFKVPELVFVLTSPLEFKRLLFLCQNVVGESIDDFVNLISFVLEEPEFTFVGGIFGTHLNCPVFVRKSLVRCLESILAFLVNQQSSLFKVEIHRLLQAVLQMPKIILQGHILLWFLNIG